MIQKNAHAFKKSSSILPANNVKTIREIAMKAKKLYIFSKLTIYYTWLLLRAASNLCNIIPLLLVNLEFSLLKIFLFCFVFVIFFCRNEFMNSDVYTDSICFYSKEYSKCCDGIQSILFLFWFYPRMEK